MKLTCAVLFTLLCLHVFGQDEKVKPKRQGGIIYAPLIFSLGYRTNSTRPGFWDFSLSKSPFRFSPVLPFIPDLAFSYNGRLFFSEHVRLAAGLGFHTVILFPSLNVPIGLEFMPFKRKRNIMFQLQSGFDYYVFSTKTAKLWGNIGFGWYFIKKEKKNE